MIVRTRARRHWTSDDDITREAFEVEGVCALATIYPVDDTTLDVWLDADITLSERQCVAAHRRVAWYLRRDDGRTTPFEHVCASIVEPYLPPHAARCVKTRITKRFGMSIVRDGTIFRAFPSPRALADVSDEQLIEAGVPAAVLERLRQAIVAFSRLELGSPEAHDRNRPTSGRTSANEKAFGSAVVHMISGAYRIGEACEGQDSHCSKPLLLFRA